MEKGRISVWQLALLCMTLIISTADVFLPAFVAQESKQDSWLAVILGTVTSLVILNIFLSLGLRHPDRNLIEYAVDILGKPLGKAVGLFFSYYFIFIAYASTREMGEIFVTEFIPEAPVLLYSIVVVIVAAYAVSKGLETIARVNEILLPIGMLVLIFIAVVNIPNIDLKNFLPILENGVQPIIKGGILVQAWLIETIAALVILPYVKEKAKIRMTMNLAVLMIGFGLQIGVMTIAVFGPLTEKMLFPALQYVRFASLGPQIENLDISIMVVWIAGIFVKITFMYYGAVLTLSQVFGLKSYQSIILPMGLIIITFSISSAKTLKDMIDFLHFIFPFYMILVAFVMPLLILAVDLARSRFSAQKKKQSAE